MKIKKSVREIFARLWYICGMSKEAVLFPGQGIAPKWVCEYYKNLNREAPKLAHCYLALAQDTLNNIHGFEAYDIGCALSCQSPELFEKTSFYQPVIAALSLAGFTYNRERSNPGYIAGHSLGECAGLIAAGGISAEEGMHLIGWRGLFMQQAAEKEASGLVNIAGLSPENIEELCQGVNGNLRAVVALKNAPAAVVLGCAEDYIPVLVRHAKEAGAIATTILQVAAAFHTPYMEQAAKHLAEKMPKDKFKELEVALIANIDGQPVEKGNVYPWKNLLDSMTKPVEWMQTMEFLKAKGIEIYRVEGPGNNVKQLCIYNNIPKLQIEGTFKKFT